MRHLLVLGILLFFISGCSLFDDSRQMNKNAEQLAAEGAAAFMNKDYKDAVKAYTDLKDWYPFSKYAILAELKIADAQFQLKQYAEAILAYESFEKMHPRNEAVPYVINQIGLCWFNQMDTIDRDPSPAKNALAQFQRLLDQYPDSIHVKEAGESIAKCIDNIAGHELYVADFYLKTKKYKAALKRYEYIVEYFPGTQQSETALGKIPECTALVNKQKPDKK
ncbi:MAG: outer membrane protein assembly factor BamD [Proteobacteria bacterium]|nr:outer membrane protein assembly factor BamD [Desulfobacula sp.]MBU3952310.1 outer membrane protein assembly factor BamD [Pseudomonadota bacterium]MBU4131289.1 outer membrane protein assembly factor BamD [Pseudomonadota bacterium]